MKGLLIVIRADLQKIAILQEDKKALERLNKSKEAALVEAEKILKSAMERALIVEEVQNQNFELKRQIEICQEENRILDKTNRQKVAEVEKLSQTISELEESILAGGGAANGPMLYVYQRQMSELNGEMQRLRDKLAVSERTAKAEAQLKDKLRLRLKTLERMLFLIYCRKEGSCEGKMWLLETTGKLEPRRSALEDDFEEEEEKEEDTALAGLDAAANEKRRVIFLRFGHSFSY